MQTNVVGRLSRVELKCRRTGGSVPQTPWNLSLFTCCGKGLIGRTVTGPPDLAVCMAPDRLIESRPCVALSSAGAKRVFPVTVSVRVYRAGNGKGQFELIAPGVTDDFTIGGEFGQS